MGELAPSRQLRVAWFAPHWSHAPQAWRAWRQLFLLGFMLRVTIASLLAMAVLLTAFKIALPLLDLNIAWRMLGAFPAIYGYLLVVAVVHLLVPERVDVRKDRVLIAHGQHASRIAANEILASRIVIFADDRIRLRFDYERQGRRRVRTVGVRPGVNLDKLTAALPVGPEVVDARCHRRTTAKNFLKILKHLLTTPNLSGTMSGGSLAIQFSK